MPKLPGVNHLDAIRSCKKAGFRGARQRKHVTMTNSLKTATIPRHNPINAITMARIVLGAGFTLDEFRRLL